MRREGSKGIAAGLLAALIGVPACGGASECEAKLAELDRRLEEGTALADGELRVVEGMRDLAASQCEEGQEETAAQLLDSMLERIAERAETEEEPPSLPKVELTAAYLEGEWCSRGAGEVKETTPHVFAADGSYRIGVLAGEGYAMHEGGDGVDDFRRRFGRLVSKEADRFVVTVNGREVVFARESCR